MNVLILSQFFPPEGTPGANRMLPLASALQARAHVTVVTLEPSYPSPTSFSAEDLNRVRPPFEVRRGFQFHPHRGGMALRAIREMTMAWRLAGLTSDLPGDLIIGTSPSMFIGPAASGVAQAKRARFIWDVRDVTWQYAAEQGNRKPAQWAASLLKRWMIATARAADLVSCANPGIAKILTTQGVGASKTLVVPNGITPEFLDSFCGDPFPLPHDKPVVTYIGVLGLNQGLSTFVEAAARVPEAQFVLVGDGAERAKLEAQAHELRLENVTFRGFIKGPALLEAYRSSDILFAQLRDRPTLADGAWPSKLFEYMAACRPIVYAGRGQAAESVAAVGAGLVVPPESPTALADAVRKLLASPAERAELAGRGRKHVEEHCHRDRIMEAFVQEIFRRFGAPRVARGKREAELEASAR